VAVPPKVGCGTLSFTLNITPQHRPRLEYFNRLLAETMSPKYTAVSPFKQLFRLHLIFLQNRRNRIESLRWSIRVRGHTEKPPTRVHQAVACVFMSWRKHTQLLSSQPAL